MPSKGLRWRRPDGTSGRVPIIVDALELNMGDELAEPRRSFTDPDEDEDMLSSVRSCTQVVSCVKVNDRGDVM